MSLLMVMNLGFAWGANGAAPVVTVTSSPGSGLLKRIKALRGLI